MHAPLAGLKWSGVRGVTMLARHSQLQASGTEHGQKRFDGRVALGAKRPVKAFAWNACPFGNRSHALGFCNMAQRS